MIKKKDNDNISAIDWYCYAVQIKALSADDEKADDKQQDKTIAVKQEKKKKERKLVSAVDDGISTAGW